MSVTASSYLQGIVPTASSGSEVPIENSPDDMGKDAFLKLLLAQLQYQDPLNPMEGVEFTGQLAQFTSLEQLYNLNDNVTGTNSALNAQNNYHALNIVGKQAKVQGNTMSILDGKSTGGSIELGDLAAEVAVSIFDENGSLVRIIDMGPTVPGEHPINWDGLDQHGNEVEDGTYTFTTYARDADRNALSVQATMVGEVTGVTFGELGQPTLILNGMEYHMGQVIEVKTEGWTEGN